MRNARKLPGVGMRAESPRQRIAVLVPCYNEEAAVAAVVAAFHKALPSAIVYVYDNNSSDRTAEIARDAGAVVRREVYRGKGRVVRRMFADLQADIYVLVDGDATYDAASAPIMIAQLVRDHLDMVVGTRIGRDRDAFRRGHRIGNRMLGGFVAALFGRTVTDVLSGYRVLSRRFVKSFPALSGGFEIETELTVHALDLGLPIGEVETPYYPRRAHSVSKLHTWRDGLRILWTIVRLCKSERPVVFFAVIAVLLALSAVLLAIPIFDTYLRSGTVPRLPTAVLATGLMLLASISLACGLVLGTVTRGRREMKVLAYLRQDPPSEQ
jgi:glycosyltransferase involved in cell wall biosynthesis